MADVVIAEFDSARAAVHAARRVRALGYRKIEAYTPFPVPELDEALAIRRTRLPYLVLFAGAAGLGVALAVQWWTNAIDYPLNVGGRPVSSIPTDVLIVFEVTVLLAAFTAFAGALVASGLPRLHHPVFDLPGFERTTLDRFWITIWDARAASDHFGEDELATIADELAELAPIAVRALGEGAP